MTEEIKVLFPNAEITIAGEKLVLKPFTLGQIPKVTKLMQQLSGPILAAYKAGKTDDIGTMFSLLAEGGDILLDLISVGVNKDRAWIDALDTSEGVELFAAFIEVNRSFFVQKTLPKFKESKEKILAGLTS